MTCTVASVARHRCTSRRLVGDGGGLAVGEGHVDAHLQGQTGRVNWGGSNGAGQILALVPAARRRTRKGKSTRGKSARAHARERQT
eukprot:2580399-Rhodomonas_salina.1